MRAGSPTQLVLVSSSGLSRRTGEDWLTTPLPDLGQFGMRGFLRYLLDGERLLIGWNGEEWGGGLIWVAQGLAHMGFTQGSLHVQDGQGWTCIASASNMDGSRENWDLPVSAFDAMSFAPCGALHMLGGAVGLVRLNQDRWEQVIPDWPGHVCVSCLHMVRDDLALIGLFDGGVLAADLAARTLRRINLGWSYYQSPLS